MTHQLEICRLLCTPPISRRAGFSLIELLVTVAIIGILATIALPQYRQYVLRAEEAAARAVLLDVYSRQEQYVMQNRGYASDLSELRLTPSAEALRSYTYSIVLDRIDDANCTVTGVPGSGTETYEAASGVPLACMPTMVATATPSAAAGAEGARIFQVNQFGLRLAKKTTDAGWSKW